MKQFFKMMFASMFGVILAGIILLFIVIGIITATVSKFSDEKETKVAANTVLHLHLSGQLQERTFVNPFTTYDFVSMQDNRETGVIDLIRGIQKAEKDAHISGIFLEFEPGFSGGFASLKDLRDAIIQFKKSGKFVYAYSELYTERNYYLATAADKVYMNPSGELIFNGMSVNITFFKSMFEKIGIEMQVFKAGKFKGAVEPFIREDLSPENREQIDVYLSSIYNSFINGIADTRKIDAEQLKEIADKMSVRTAQLAVDYKMVDALKHHDEVLAQIRTQLGIGTEDKINFITAYNYRDIPAEKKEGEDSDSQGKIAILYATGDIVDGQGDGGSIGSHSLRESIIKARTSKSIKAVVLRINSPGGSALASDVILRELILLQKTKPLIVSMGDVAASGGYYIAMAADTIVAEPNTITGSIGVFGMLPNMQHLLNDKLGIRIDGVKKGQFSDLGRADRPLTTSESEIIQHYVEEVYRQFLGVVSTGRNMDTAAVHEIAQGRVWTGADAKERGLVDVMGGIQTALDIAAKKAGLTNYRISELPIEKNPFQEFFKGMSAETKAQIMQEELGESYTYYMQMKRVMQHQGVLTRMPFEMTID
jgi:protease IV